MGDRGCHLPGEGQPLAPRQLAPGGEEALRGLQELPVRGAQLRGRALDLGLQRLVEAGHPVEHPVQPLGHRPDLVGTDARRTGGEVARGRAGHRVEDGGQRPVHEAPGQEVEAQGQQEDGRGRED